MPAAACKRRCFLTVVVPVQGFVTPAARSIVISADTPEALIDLLAAYEAPPSIISLASLASGKVGLSPLP